MAKSTAQKAEEAVARLEAWLAERAGKGDWEPYIIKTGLSISDIAAEAGIGRSSLYTNVALKSRLDAANRELSEAGLWAPPADTGVTQNVPTRAATDPRDAEIKRLREALAERTAEIAALRRELATERRTIEELAPMGGRLFPGAGV